MVIGLSKERPILDHHPKSSKWNAALFIWNVAFFIWNAVLFMKCGTFHMKSSAFREKWRFSYEKHLKSLKTADSTQISHLDLVFHRVQREGHLWKALLFVKSAAFHMKSTTFHEKHRFSKDHLQGIVTLCFGTLIPAGNSSNLVR